MSSSEQKSSAQQEAPPLKREVSGHHKDNEVPTVMKNDSVVTKAPHAPGAGRCGEPFNDDEADTNAVSVQRSHSQMSSAANSVSAYTRDSFFFGTPYFKDRQTKYAKCAQRYEMDCCALNIARRTLTVMRLMNDVKKSSPLSSPYHWFRSYSTVNDFLFYPPYPTYSFTDPAEKRGEEELRNTRSAVPYCVAPVEPMNEEKGKRRSIRHYFRKRLRTALRKKRTARTTDSDSTSSGVGSSSSSRAGSEGRGNARNYHTHNQYERTDNAGDASENQLEGQPNDSSNGTAQATELRSRHIVVREECVEGQMPDDEEGNATPEQMKSKPHTRGNGNTKKQKQKKEKKRGKEEGESFGNRYPQEHERCEPEHFRARGESCAKSGGGNAHNSEQSSALRVDVNMKAPDEDAQRKKKNHSEMIYIPWKHDVTFFDDKAVEEFFTLTKGQMMNAAHSLDASATLFSHPTGTHPNGESNPTLEDSAARTTTVDARTGGLNSGVVTPQLRMSREVSTLLNPRVYTRYDAFSLKNDNWECFAVPPPPQPEDHYEMVAEAFDSTCMPHAQHMSIGGPLFWCSGGCPIPCTVTRPSRQMSTHIGIFFHTNGDDVGPPTQSAMRNLANALHLTVFAPEYPGYGMFAGEPSEAALCGTVERFIQYLFTVNPHLTPSRIIILGRSIGSCVAVYAAKVITELFHRITEEVPWCECRDSPCASFDRDSNPGSDIDDSCKALTPQQIASRATFRPDYWKNHCCIHDRKIGADRTLNCVSVAVQVNNRSTDSSSPNDADSEKNESQPSNEPASPATHKMCRHCYLGGMMLISSLISMKSVGEEGRTGHGNLCPYDMELRRLATPSDSIIPAPTSWACSCSRKLSSKQRAALQIPTLPIFFSVSKVYTLNRFDNSKALMELQEKYSLFSHTPILFIHGASDSMIPSFHSVALASGIVQAARRACTRGSVPKTHAYVNIVSDASHDSIAFVDVARRFYRDHVLHPHFEYASRKAAEKLNNVQQTLAKSVLLDQLSRQTSSYANTVPHLHSTNPGATAGPKDSANAADMMNHNGVVVDDGDDQHGLATREGDEMSDNRHGTSISTATPSPAYVLCRQTCASFDTGACEGHRRVRNDLTSPEAVTQTHSSGSDADGASDLHPKMSFNTQAPSSRNTAKHMMSADEYDGGAFDAGANETKASCAWVGQETPPTSYSSREPQFASCAHDKSNGAASDASGNSPSRWRPEGSPQFGQVGADYRASRTDSRLPELHENVDGRENEKFTSWQLNVEFGPDETLNSFNSTILSNVDVEDAFMGQDVGGITRFSALAFSTKPAIAQKQYEAHIRWTLFWRCFVISLIVIGGLYALVVGIAHGVFTQQGRLMDACGGRVNTLVSDRIENGYYKRDARVIAWAILECVGLLGIAWVSYFVPLYGFGSWSKLPPDHNDVPIWYFAVRLTSYLIVVAMGVFFGFIVALAPPHRGGADWGRWAEETGLEPQCRRWIGDVPRWTMVAYGSAHLAHALFFLLRNH